MATKTVSKPAGKAPAAASKAAPSKAAGKAAAKGAKPGKSLKAVKAHPKAAKPVAKAAKPALKGKPAPKAAKAAPPKPVKLVKVGAAPAAGRTKETAPKHAGPKPIAKAPAPAKAAKVPAKPAPKPAGKPSALASSPTIPSKRGSAVTQQPSKKPTTKPAPGRGQSAEAAPQAADLAALSPRPNWIPDIEAPTGRYDGIMLVDKVKPFPEKSPYSQQEIDRLREALNEEKRRLQDELASLAGASREALDLTREHPGYSVHMAEHATDLQTAEANMGVRTIEEQRLAQVDAALDRIQRRPDRYGLCLACGNKVGIQRLIAQPHAHLCMDCRTRYEKVKSRRGY